MTSCCLILLALLLPTQGSLATVSGEILDREGKPMVGAQITYQKIGIVDRNIRGGEGSRSESPAMWRERAGSTKSRLTRKVLSSWSAWTTAFTRLT